MSSRLIPAAFLLGSLTKTTTPESCASADPAISAQGNRRFLCGQYTTKTFLEQ
jgi:hypothetical protein